MSVTRKRALEIANTLERSSHLVSQKEIHRYGLELRNYINREPKRKIVQILFESGTYIGLANDGTLWTSTSKQLNKWSPLHMELPQPE